MEPVALSSKFLDAIKLPEKPRRVFKKRVRKPFVEESAESVAEDKTSFPCPATLISHTTCLTYTSSPPVQSTISSRTVVTNSVSVSRVKVNEQSKDGEMRSPNVTRALYIYGIESPPSSTEDGDKDQDHVNKMLKDNNQTVSASQDETYDQKGDNISSIIDTPTSDREGGSSSIGDYVEHLNEIEEQSISPKKIAPDILPNTKKKDTGQTGDETTASITIPHNDLGDDYQFNCDAEEEELLKRYEDDLDNTIVEDIEVEQSVDDPDVTIKINCDIQPNNTQGIVEERTNDLDSVTPDKTESNAECIQNDESETQEIHLNNNKEKEAQQAGRELSDDNETAKTSGIEPGRVIHTAKCNNTSVRANLGLISVNDFENFQQDLWETVQCTDNTNGYQSDEENSEAVRVESVQSRDETQPEDQIVGDIEVTESIDMEIDTVMNEIETVTNEVDIEQVVSEMEPVEEVPAIKKLKDVAVQDKKNGKIVKSPKANAVVQFMIPDKIVVNVPPSPPPYNPELSDEAPEMHSPEIVSPPYEPIDEVDDYDEQVNLEKEKERAQKTEIQVLLERSIVEDYEPVKTPRGRGRPRKAPEDNGAVSNDKSVRGILKKTVKKNVNIVEPFFSHIIDKRQVNMLKKMCILDDTLSKSQIEKALLANISEVNHKKAEKSVFFMLKYDKSLPGTSTNEVNEVNVPTGNFNSNTDLVNNSFHSAYCFTANCTTSPLNSEISLTPPPVEPKTIVSYTSDPSVSGETTQIVSPEIYSPVDNQNLTANLEVQGALNITNVFSTTETQHLSMNLEVQDTVTIADGSKKYILTIPVQPTNNKNLYVLDEKTSEFISSLSLNSNSEHVTVTSEPVEFNLPTSSEYASSLTKLSVPVSEYVPVTTQTQSKSDNDSYNIDKYGTSSKHTRPESLSPPSNYQILNPNVPVTKPIGYNIDSTGDYAYKMSNRESPRPRSNEYVPVSLTSKKEVTKARRKSKSVELPPSKRSSNYVPITAPLTAHSKLEPNSYDTEYASSVLKLNNSESLPRDLSPPVCKTSEYVISDRLSSSETVVYNGEYATPLLKPLAREDSPVNRSEYVPVPTESLNVNPETLNSYSIANPEDYSTTLSSLSSKQEKPPLYIPKLPLYSSTKHNTSPSFINDSSNDYVPSVSSSSSYTNLYTKDNIDKPQLLSTSTPADNLIADAPMEYIVITEPNRSEPSKDISVNTMKNFPTIKTQDTSVTATSDITLIKCVNLSSTPIGAITTSESDIKGSDLGRLSVTPPQVLLNDTTLTLQAITEYTKAFVSDSIQLVDLPLTSVSETFVRDYKKIEPVTTVKDNFESGHLYNSTITSTEDEVVNVVNVDYDENPHQLLEDAYHLTTNIANSRLNTESTATNSYPIFCNTYAAFPKVPLHSNEDCNCERTLTPKTPLPRNPPSDFSNSSDSSLLSNEVVQRCIQQTSENKEEDNSSISSTYFSNNSNFYQDNSENNTNNAVPYIQPSIIPDSYDFDKNNKNEVFNKIDASMFDKDEYESSSLATLPLKKRKRKLSIASSKEDPENEEEALDPQQIEAIIAEARSQPNEKQKRIEEDKKVCYPGTTARMMNIAEVKEKFFSNVSEFDAQRTFKTLAERKEIPPLPSGYLVNSESPQKATYIPPPAKKPRTDTYDLKSPGYPFTPVPEMYLADGLSKAPTTDLNKSLPLQDPMRYPKLVGAPDYGLPQYPTSSIGSMGGPTQYTSYPYSSPTYPLVNIPSVAHYNSYMCPPYETAQCPRVEEAHLQKTQEITKKNTRTTNKRKSSKKKK